MSPSWWVFGWNFIVFFQKIECSWSLEGNFVLVVSIDSCIQARNHCYSYLLEIWDSRSTIFSSDWSWCLRPDGFLGGISSLKKKKKSVRVRCWEGNFALVVSIDSCIQARNYYYSYLLEIWDSRITIFSSDWSWCLRPDGFLVEFYSFPQKNRVLECGLGKAILR